MNDCTTIHETVVRDIVSVIDDFKSSDALKVFNNPKSFRSASKATSNLILTFPMICSSNLTIEEMTMVMKSHERKCAMIMKMLFTAISVADNDNALEYIRGIHNNMNMRDNDISIDYAMSALDNLAAKEEATNPRFNSEYYKLIREDMKNLNYGLETKYLKEESIGRFKYYGVDGKWKIGTINEGASGSFYQRLNDIETTLKDVRKSVDAQKQITISNVNTNAGRSGGGKGGNKDYTAEKNINQSINQSFLSSDIKKANELVPTMMIVNFYEDGESDRPLTAVIGIKAKVYPVSSQEIIDRIVSKNKDNHGLFNLIRVATRETSFFKDFVFALDKAKLDANASSHRGMDSQIWKLLERRALKSRVKTSLGMKNDATAISIVVISQDEVDYLKKEYNLDIMRIGVIKPIMSAYNLMGFVILNNTLNVAKFLYDDDSNAYETLSYRSLERDGENKDYKEIVNLMSKMAR